MDATNVTGPHDSEETTPEKTNKTTTVTVSSETPFDPTPATAIATISCVVSPRFSSEEQPNNPSTVSEQQRTSSTSAALSDNEEESKVVGSRRQRRHNRRIRRQSAELSHFATPTSIVVHCSETKLRSSPPDELSQPAAQTTQLMSSSGNNNDDNDQAGRVRVLDRKSVV